MLACPPHADAICGLSHYCHPVSTSIATVRSTHTFTVNALIHFARPVPLPSRPIEEREREGAHARGHGGQPPVPWRASPNADRRFEAASSRRCVPFPATALHVRHSTTSSLSLPRPCVCDTLTVSAPRPTRTLATTTTIG
jgi:hypothetical protein